MDIDARDIVAGVGFGSFTAGLYLLVGLPGALLIDGAMLLSLAMWRV